MNSSMQFNEQSQLIVTLPLSFINLLGITKCLNRPSNELGGYLQIADRSTPSRYKLWKGEDTKTRNEQQQTSRSAEKGDLLLGSKTGKQKTPRPVSDNWKRKHLGAA